MNLSPALPETLADCYSQSKHVRDVGLKSASDAEVWAHAADGDFEIVTRDSDFRQRSFLQGHPPMIICIGLGNCSTRQSRRCFGGGSLK